MPIAYHIYDKILGYDHIDWNKKLKTKGAKMFKTMEGANETARNSKKKITTPSHSFEEYTGTYEHLGYGALKIETKDSSLKLTYNHIEYALNHKCYDIFTMTMMEYYVIAITSDYDSDGTIKSISIPFEQSVKEIVFTKI